jgi:hypothetical protein
MYARSDALSTLLAQTLSLRKTTEQQNYQIARRSSVLSTQNSIVYGFLSLSSFLGGEPYRAATERTSLIVR